MIFIDRIFSNPRQRKFKIIDTTDDIMTVELQDDLENIVEKGTPINAENMELFKQDILNLAYPIGRGFIDFTNTDYSNYLGFTWERELVGMTAVGLDSTQTEFNTIGKTGGNKNMQQHNHLGKMFSLNYNAGSSLPYNRAFARSFTDSGSGVWSFAGTGAVTNGQIVDTTETGNAGIGTAQNLQPYKVVSYWKRIA